MNKRLVLVGDGHSTYRTFENIIKEYFVVGVVSPNKDILIEDLCKKNNIKISYEIEDAISWNPDLIFVMVYPKTIGKNILDKVSVINVHYALLPKYRGLHAVSWAIINDEEEVGYTIHLMNEELDAGDILFQYKIENNKKDNAWDIIQKFDTHIAENICNILKRYFSGKLNPVEQDESKAKYVGKRNLYDCYINWSDNNQSILNLIRAVNIPYPGAFTIFKNKKIIILDAEIYQSLDYEEIYGHILKIIKDKGVVVKTGDGTLLIKRIVVDNEEMLASEYFKYPGGRLGIDFIEEYLRNKGF